MKVALITLHAIKNYGSVLQTLATQEIFKEYGCDVKLINYIREDSLDKNLLHTWCGSNPVKQIAMLPTCTMNFINGLHARGIGSCCLQWSNKHAEDLKVRKALELQDSERIAVVIAAGYYLEETVIPCSVRKSVDDIYKEI